MRPRLDRQTFLGPDSDRLLWELRVAVVGLGGGGSHIVQQLAHVGVGHFCLFDSDRVDDTNLNRLVGATETDAASTALKVEVAERVIRGIDSSARVHSVPRRWQEEHLSIRECNVVFGCVDRFSERRELEAYCRRFMVPYIDIGMDVHKVGHDYSITGQVILSMPGEPCMNCLGFLRLDQEQPAYLDAGGRPQVVWPNGVLASVAVGVFVRLVTPWRRSKGRIEYLEYDGNTQRVGASPTLEYVHGVVCPHFPVDAVGDAF